MKKQTFILALGFLFAGFFTACEKDSLNLVDLDVIEVRGQSGPLSWNDACPGDDLTLTLGESGNRQIQQLINGVWTNIASASGGSDPLVATIGNVEVGTYSFRYKVGGGGFSATVEITIEPCCVNNLSVDLVCGETRTATFTFTAEEDGPIVIQGGLTSGTSIVSASSNVLTQNTTHPSNGGPSNVTRWEGDVEACATVTVTITFTGGNGIGDWTAKRGDETLGSTAAMTCN